MLVSASARLTAASNPWAIAALTALRFSGRLRVTKSDMVGDLLVED